MDITTLAAVVQADTNPQQAATAALAVVAAVQYFLELVAPVVDPPEITVQTELLEET
jgi:hypothetical protein